jgi:ribonuclease E
MTEPVARDATASAPEPEPPAEPATTTDPGSPDDRPASRRRRRGSRGGRGRNRPRESAERVGVDDVDEIEPLISDDGAEGGVASTAEGASATAGEGAPSAGASPARQSRAARGLSNSASPAASGSPAAAASVGSAASDPGDDDRQPELPERPIEGKIQSPEVAAQVLVPRPRIGDTRPAPPPAKRRETVTPPGDGRRRRRGTRGKGGEPRPAAASAQDEPIELDETELERRRGKERKGRPVGRYLMGVHVTPAMTQIAVLEGRSLIEHFVSRPADDVGQIHGNIYLGRVQNVLPGMEAAFVDIGTPKNAVLYRGDVQYDAEDIVEGGDRPRIEQMLRAKQVIVCQVTKNPIGAKGARLTQEVSLPGRFIVLIPNSRTYGISKRLPDEERRRLRSILDRVKPAEHGVIVRTAAENVVEDELRRDVERLLAQWSEIEALARKRPAPSLLYREPDMAVRVIREEFNKEYRGVVIDDAALHAEVESYVTSISPTLADRVEHYDVEGEGLPLFEKFHIHEQLHKALDRKVWLPSGGSLIIEHAEALTVIDVNTGKNVGTSNLEETVFHNNLEAAEEIARQLRLRDIGGIIVIDFIDMEQRENRAKVMAAFREALARDKTRTQVFDISELGLVEMTRKRIGEGLLTSFADPCPTCEGRGVLIDHELLE